MRGGTIRRQLFLAMAGVVVLTVIPTAIYTSSRQFHASERGLVGRAVALTRLVAFELAPGLDERLTAMEVQRAAAQDPDFRYAVLFDDKGDLIAASGLPRVVDVRPGVLVAATDDDAPPQEINGGAPPDLVVDPVDDRFDIVRVRAPVVSGNGHRGVVVTGFSTSASHAEARGIAAVAVAWSVGLFALGLLAAFALARSLAHRIDPLVVGTRAVARGDLKHRIAAVGNDELAQLARDFNDMAEGLENADEAKNTFFAGVTHELRAPLNSIIGFVDLVLEAERGLGDGSKRNLERVATSARRLRNLVDTILDFAKMNAGRMEARLAPFDVAVMLDDVAGEARALARGLPLEITAECERPLLFLSDAEKTRRILVNLASNAVKFTPEGKITLRAERSGDTVCFTVEDTGVGVDPAMRERIFEPFQQAPGTNAAGTGLGLAIVRDLAGLLGGSASLEAHDGAGSRFRVVIPVGRSTP